MCLLMEVLHMVCWQTGHLAYRLSFFPSGTKLALCFFLTCLVRVVEWTNTSPQKLHFFGDCKKQWDVSSQSKSNKKELFVYQFTWSCVSSLCQFKALSVEKDFPHSQNKTLAGLSILPAGGALCLRLCSDKLEYLLKPLPHMLHNKGASPVCVRMCSWNKTWHISQVSTT